MTDLVNDSNAQSPKRKFSFRFPHLVHHGDKELSSTGNGQHHKGMHGAKTRNFSEEVKNVPDLQVICSNQFYFLFHQTNNIHQLYFVDSIILIKLILKCCLI